MRTVKQNKVEKISKGENAHYCLQMLTLKIIHTSGDFGRQKI